jgi:hypothetical protein
MNFRSTGHAAKKKREAKLLAENETYYLLLDAGITLKAVYARHQASACWGID